MDRAPLAILKHPTLKQRSFHRKNFMKRSMFAACGGVLALTLAFLTVAPAHAQTTLGVRGGFSGASIDVDGAGDLFDDSNRTGFVGGVFLDWGGSNLFGFQVGAQYTQKGAEIDVGNVIEDLTLDYFEIPAVVKLGIPLGALKPSVFAGASLGFNTGCDLDGGDCDDATSTEWAGIFGADVAFYLGGLSLWVDGRYHYGLSEVSDISAGAQFDELKNRAWAFQAGLGFPLGG
jgi:hypothetical protein